MIKRILLLVMLSACAVASQAQVAKGTGLFYFTTQPTLPVDVCYDGEVGIDTATGLWWEYSRDFGFWIPAGFRVQKTVTCAKPTYTPVDKQSEIVITPCDSLYRFRDGQWWHLNKYTVNTDNQNLTIEGSGPSYTIDISGGTDVNIAPGGIITLSESPANTLVISATEVDGDTLNEIQVVDTFAIVNDTLRLSLSKDAQPFKLVSLGQYRDSTNLTYTGSTSPVTLNSSTGSDVTITAGTGITLSANSANLTISATQPDGSETKVQGGNGIQVSGAGTTANPYVVSPPSGTNTQTLRYNGATLEASSALRNNGTQVSVGGEAVGSNLLTINQAAANDGILVKSSPSPTKGVRLYNTNSLSLLESDTFNLALRSFAQLRLEPSGGAGFSSQIIAQPQANITSTSTNTALFDLSPAYSPSASGGSFSYLYGSGAINQSGGANQDIRGFDFNPTLTSLQGQLYGVFHRPSVGRFIWQPNGDTVYSHLRGRLGLGADATTSTHRLYVDGTMRLTGSSGTAATLMGRNANGEVSAVSVGSNLTLSGGTLSASGGTTDLSYSGSSSPVTLNSSSGADVTITAGTGITLSANSSNLTINATQPDGSETKVQGSNGIQVTGTGTTANPYVVAPPSGSTTQTLRYNGTTLEASSALRNNGTQVSINGAAAGSNLLTVKQSGNGDGVLVAAGGTTSKGIRIYNTANVSLLESDSLTLSVRGSSQVRLEPIGGSGLLTQAFIIPQNNITLPATDATLLELFPRYSPSSAGGSFSYIHASGEVNQGGSANQDVRGFDFNPGITSVLGQLYGVFHRPSVGRFLWQPNGDTVYSHLRGRLGIGSGATTSSHRLYVEGTMRLTGSSGTATTLMGRNSTGEVSAITVGSGLTLSGNTLTASSGGITGAENGLSVVGSNVRLGGDLIIGTTINHANNLLHFRNGPLRTSATNTAGTGWNQRVGFRGFASNPSTSATPTADGILDIHAENTDGTNTNTSMTVGAMATSANGMWVQARNNSTYNSYLPLHLNPRGGSVAVGAGASAPGARFSVQAFSLTGTGVSSLNQLLVQGEGHGEVRLGFGNTISTHNAALSWVSASDVLRVINLNSTNSQSRIGFSIGGYAQSNEVATIVKSSASTLARAGFGTNNPNTVHSTLQSSGSLATAYLETSGAPTFDETKRTVIYVGSSNVTWTLPSSSSCNCEGREYILHNASASSTITLSQPVSKANGSSFNALSPGEWAHIFYGATFIRGYKLTSN